MRKTIFGIIILLVVLYGFSLISRIYFGEGEGEVAITIEKGEQLVSVAGKLVAGEVLRDDDIWLFDLYARVTDKDRAIKAGSFTLAKDMPIADIFVLLSVPSSTERSLTFIEGWNLRDIAEYLYEQDIIKGEKDLYEITGVPARDYRIEKGVPEHPITNIGEPNKEKPNYVSLEGYLFPDTYRFYENVTVDEIVQTLVNEFDEKYTELDKNADHSNDFNYTFHELITMASIIEAEVQSTEDRRKVADIMWRRLEDDWPLQVDSSVNYVTQKNTPSASAKDLQADSRYNTYKNRGLPPGPINNPSLDAFKATVSPIKNDFWFFLTSPDGTVHYARTIEEHAANRKYL